MDLADRIIEANEDNVVKREGDKAPDGYYTDDLGYWVEVDLHKDRRRYAEYTVLRCRIINPGLHTRENRTMLFNGRTRVNPTQNDIVSLSNTLDSITTPQAIWVYNRLIESVPALDTNIVLVAKDLAWDFKKQELIDMKGKKYITTDGGIWNYD